MPYLAKELVKARHGPCGFFHISSLSFLGYNDSRPPVNVRAAFFIDLYSVYCNCYF